MTRYFKNTLVPFPCCWIHLVQQHYNNDNQTSPTLQGTNMLVPLKTNMEPENHLFFSKEDHLNQTSMIVFVIFQGVGAL